MIVEVVKDPKTSCLEFPNIKSSFLTCGCSNVPIYLKFQHVHYITHHCCDCLLNWTSLLWLSAQLQILNQCPLNLVKLKILNCVMVPFVHSIIMKIAKTIQIFNEILLEQLSLPLQIGNSYYNLIWFEIHLLGFTDKGYIYKCEKILKQTSFALFVLPVICRVSPCAATLCPMNHEGFNIKSMNT